MTFEASRVKAMLQKRHGREVYRAKLRRCAWCEGKLDRGKGTVCRKCLADEYQEGAE